MTIRIPKPLAISAVVLVVAGAIAAAFIVGRASIDQRTLRRTAYANGYSQGQTDGFQSGRTSGYTSGLGAGKTLAKFESQAAYTRGYNAAVAKANGKIPSTLNAGQNLAFAGYSGWDIGHYYVVLIGPGTNGAQYAMPSRIEMVPGQAYDLCSTSNGICGGPIP